MPYGRSTRRAGQLPDHHLDRHVLLPILEQEDLPRFHYGASCNNPILASRTIRLPADTPTTDCAALHPGDHSLQPARRAHLSMKAVSLRFPPGGEPAPESINHPFHAKGKVGTEDTELRLVGAVRGRHRAPSHGRALAAGRGGLRHHGRGDRHPQCRTPHRLGQPGLLRPSRATP